MRIYVLLPILLAAALALATPPPNDVLWNGAPAPQQAVAFYPVIYGANSVLGCRSAGGTLPSQWTLEILAYHLPTPIPQTYVVDDSWQGLYTVYFGQNGKTTIITWDINNVAYGSSYSGVGWKHILISYDGYAVRHWANGQLVYQASASLKTSYSRIAIWVTSSDPVRIFPLVVAWVKLWSGAVTSQSQADQLARGQAPSGFSLVSGIDYTTWPPRVLAGSWDCNGKLFGVPVVRIYGAYVDSRWWPTTPSGFSALGRLLGFGYTGAMSMAFSLAPIPDFTTWWSITALHYSSGTSEPWIGIGNMYSGSTRFGGYGGPVVVTNAVYGYGLPRGAYSGVYTCVAEQGCFLNGTQVLSSFSAGVWAPWWRGLRAVVTPSGTAPRALIRWVWVQNATSQQMDTSAVLVDYRWWPPLSSVGAFGTWAHPAYLATQPPGQVTPLNASGVVQTTQTWLGALGALLPATNVVNYAGATNLTGAHWGAKYVWATQLSAYQPVAVVPTTRTLAGWYWSAPSAPTAGNPMTISLSGGQSATLYALASAPGTYTVTVSTASGGANIGAGSYVRLVQGYDVLCSASASSNTASLSLTCNAPPGVSRLEINITAAASDTFRISLTWSPPPAGSASSPAIGTFYLAKALNFHHYYVYNGLVLTTPVWADFDEPVGSGVQQISLPKYSALITSGGFYYPGVADTVTVYTNQIVDNFTCSVLILANAYARDAFRFAIPSVTGTCYTTTREVLYTASPLTGAGVSIYAPGLQMHVWYDGSGTPVLKTVVGDLQQVPKVYAEPDNFVVYAPVGAQVRLWRSDGTYFTPLAGGVLDGQTYKISPWSGTWLSATLRFLYADYGVYTIYVRNTSTWFYMFTTQLAGTSDVVVRFPYPAPYKIEVWRDGARMATVETWLDSGSMVYVDTVSGRAQSVVLMNKSGAAYVNPMYTITNQPMPPWQLLIYVLSSLAVAVYLYRRSPDKGAIAYSAMFDAVVLAIGVYLAVSAGGNSPYAQLAGAAAVLMLIKAAVAALPARL